MRGKDLIEQKEPQPRLWTRLTYACNNRCLFCLDGDQNDKGKPVPFAAVVKELAKGRARGLRRVVLSGGEPTLHPRFVDVVREARRRGFTHVQVITNGRRFCYPRFLKDCAAAGLSEITFSMHGHTPELYERLVGVPGSFPQALSGLSAALRVPGLIVSVDVVLNRLNVDRLEELLRFYVRLGVREFDLLHLVPFGRAWDRWDELYFDPSRKAEALRRGFALSREGVRLWTNRLPAAHLEGYEDLIQPPEKIKDEVRGRGAMFAALLSRGAKPDCRGPRCVFCFLRSFCEDLLLLRREGRLEAKPMPRCLGMAGKATTETFKWEGKTKDIQKFTGFYIRQRYTAKGRVCRNCGCRGRCEGAPIRLIKERGFRILLPYKKRTLRESRRDSLKVQDPSPEYG